MKTIESCAPPPSRLPSKKILGLGAFAFSVLVHGSLLLLVGGVVVIQAVVPKQVFTDFSPPSETVTDQETPPEEQPVQDNPVPSTEETIPIAPVPIANSTPDIVMTENVNLLQSFSAPTVSGTAEGLPAIAVSSNAPASSGNPGKSGVRNMTSLFGNKGEATDGLTGYLYDFKQGPDQKPTDMAEVKDEKATNNTKENNLYREVVKDFIKNWNPIKLKPFYRSKEPLSTFQIFIPSMEADAAPKAFGVQKEVKPRRWLIHYKGEITAPSSGAIRFVGLGDDVLVVRFNNRMVFDGSWIILDASANDKGDGGPSLGTTGMPLRVGQWFNITQGTSYPIEVLIGETPGGKFSSFLMVQEKNKEYKMRKNNKSLLLPVFQTASTRLPSYREEVEAPEVAKEPFVFNVTQ